MKRAFIICTSFFDFKCGKVTIGGMQTYFLNLVPILKSHGFSVYITSVSDKDEKIQYDGFTVLGFALFGKRTEECLSKKLSNLVRDDDLVIYGTDTMISDSCHFKKSIAIQHGVFWDVPYYFRKRRSIVRMMLPRIRDTYKTIKRLDKVGHIVCVDYNFINWYRTQVDYAEDKFTVIPNFADYLECPLKSKDTIKIIFARRLEAYRGTRVFAKTAEMLLNKYNNIDITIAGSGPDEELLKTKLSKWDSKVHFISYLAKDSLQIHSDKNIAVIPTVGSEGTSLSLLEAMGAHCAVVCSNVGGMTNIVLDEYNGLIVNAGDYNDLFRAICKLIEDEKFREQIANRAFDTVRSAFSHAKWERQWAHVIEEFCDD